MMAFSIDGRQVFAQDNERTTRRTMGQLAVAEPDKGRDKNRG